MIQKTDLVELNENSFASDDLNKDESLANLNISDLPKDGFEYIDAVENILDLNEEDYPSFTLAKNKARFLRMVNWYHSKEEWLEVAPMSGIIKLSKQQTKELENIRANKMDYEMELEMDNLTSSQRAYRKDEFKMCKVQEKMAVHLISKMQLKIKSARR